MGVNEVKINGQVIMSTRNDTVDSDNLLLDETATNRRGDKVRGLVDPVNIDSELSNTSTNPVENKVITQALEARAYKDDIPTNASQLENDAGYISEGEIPQNLSQLENDTGFITSDALPTKVSELENDAGYITQSAVPTKTSELTNDSGYITSADVPTKTSELTNDSGFITSADVPTKTSELTNDSGYITSAAVPTKTSQLTNDSGFVDNDNAYIITDTAETTLNDADYIPFYDSSATAKRKSLLSTLANFILAKLTLATTSANGLLKKLPSTDATSKFLRGDGDWANLPVTVDEKVKQTATSTNADYEVLFSESADNTTRTEGAGKSASLKYNPSTGNLQATQLNGKTIGNNPKFTDTTYSETSTTSNGLAPQLPSTDATSKFLRGDKQWATPPVSADEKVKQTATTTSADYEVLFSESANNTTTTEGARKNSNLKFNPSTGNLQATQLNGVNIGSSPKFSDTTYNVVSTTENGLAPKVTDTSGFLKGDGTWSTPPVSADEKVKQTATSTSADYELLFSESANNTTSTEGARKNSNLKFNPSTGNLQTTQLNGVNIGSSPKFTDTNDAVTQTASSGDANYEVLFSVSADNTTKTEGARKSANLKFNPSTGNLQATQLNGKNIGNDPKFTDTTYNVVSTTSNGLAPKVTDTSGFLKGDGTWSTPPVSADEKVKQTATSTSADYEILFSESANNTTSTEGARKNNNLKFNPSTGNLQTTQLNGVNIGSSPKFSDTTYNVVSTTENGLAPKVTDTSAFLKGDGTWATPPVSADEKVKQTATSTSADYEVLFSESANNTTSTEGARKNTNLKFNPSTGNLQTTQLNGVNIGSSPKFTDTNDAVTQTATTTSADYEVLFSNSADNTTKTEGARKNSNLKFNPSTGNLQATQLNGVNIGSSPKFSDTTYNVVSTTENGLAPKVTDTSGFLKGDGTWATPPASADEKVKQTATSTSADYEILFSESANNTTSTEGARKNSNLKFNPSTGNLQATQLNGVNIGSSPKFSDTNDAVTQTVTSTSGDYEVLFSGTADNTTRTEGARKNNNLKFNPSTGNLQATQLNGVNIGNSPKFSDTWTGMTGATSSANGSVGYINTTPPKDGYNTKYWRADGTWAVPDKKSFTTQIKTLTAGSTQVTFNDLTYGDIIYDVNTDMAGLNYTAIAASTPSNNKFNLTLTYDAQSVDVRVLLKIESV